MRKAPLHKPFLVINPKAYLYGKEVVDLAVYVDQLAQDYDIDVLFTAQLVDLPEIAEKTYRLIPTAQHTDGLKPGKGMGHVLACALKERNIQATFLNHAENPLSLSDLYQSIQRANENNLLSIVCANTLDEAKALSVFSPDVMVCEQNELIGTGKTADEAYMRETSRAVLEISPTTLVLQAAGISSGEDVYRAISFGADGSGGTSGIVLADDPKLVIKDMFEALKRAKIEMKEGR